MSTVVNDRDLILENAASRFASTGALANLGYVGALNATANFFSQGPQANRPTGNNGDMYYATDVSTLFQMVSGSWVVVSTVGAPAGTLVAGTDAATVVSNAATALYNANAAKDSATAANTAIGYITSDNYLSMSEKSAVIADWTVIQSEKPGIDTNADTVAVSRTDYDNAYTALSNYLGTLTNPAWNDVTKDTPIVGTTFRTNFSNYYSAKQSLLNAIATKASTMASGVTIGANGALSGAGGGQVTIAGLGYTGHLGATKNIITSGTAAPASPSDGDIWINTGTPVVINTRVAGVWVAGGNIATSLSQVDTSAASKLNGVATGATANAVSTGTGAPAAASGNNGDFFYSTDTHILYQKVTGTWNQCANNYTNTSQLTDDKGLGQTAIWLSVSGTGKPADNATVGATLGTNVNGQITPTNSASLIGAQAIGSVQISDLRTTNYAEDSSGNATAGAKLASTGTSLKVANNSFQVGTLVFSDYWFRLVQGIDGSVSSNRLIWRGNNDATTRGGAPNINCLSVIAKSTDVTSFNGTTTNDGFAGYSTTGSGKQVIYHTFKLTPTTYATNTDNLDAMQQMHVQLFAKTTDTSPFMETYLACPSRTYDAATGAVQSSWAIGFGFNGPALNNDGGTPSPSDPQLSGIAPNILFNMSSDNKQYVFLGCLRIRIGNTYGWSATKDFGPTGTLPANNSSAGPGSGSGGTLQNNIACPTTTITGVAGSSGGGSGASGGACPAPWVKVRLLNGKEVNASDLHNGARLAAVNDSTMQPLPQGGVVRDLATIWARRYRVKLSDGTATEWSENHRFAVAERGWVTVQNLRGGDHILGLKESVVDSVLAVGEGQVVSFRVEGAGTYFAGGLLCHNTKAAF